MAKKGQKFKIWSAEEKYQVIKPIVDMEVSLTQVGKETGISNSMLYSWTKSYKERGFDGLNNKKKPGNPLMKYLRRKTLTKEEQLEYENMKLKIENKMYIDFDINNYTTVQEFIDDIVWNNNNYRPSYALNYKTPIEYRTQLGYA